MLLTRQRAALAAAAMVVAFQQGVAIRALKAPEAEIPYEFTQVEQIRELPDGRVLVLDTGEELVAVADFRDGSVRRLGRLGSGPAEYRLPARLLPVAGGATALLDGGNRRVLRIDAAGSISLFDAMARAQSGGPAWIDAYASDSNGHFYRPAEPVRLLPGGRTALVDSVAIERFNVATGTMDSAAFMRIDDGFERTLEPGARIVRVEPRSRPLAFAAADQWAVAPEGRIAVVSVDPFRVTYFARGERINGPMLQVERLAVTDRDKEAWLASRRRPQQALIQRGRQGPRYRVMAPAPMSNVPVDFPTYFPAFTADALHFAPDGMLWIHRATPIDSLPRHDVVDQRGRIVRRVILPRRTRLVGFGRRSLYLIRVDDDELQYLQRYPF